MSKYPQFKNDYSVLACKEVMEALCKYHLEINEPYGDDYHSANAKQIIKDYFKVNNSDVYLLPGGTITNLTFIAHALNSYEAIIACDSGHINVHETGAIEQTGHKIITVPAVNGKLTVEEVDKAFLKHVDHHMVKPKLVYISNTTEIGSVYLKNELASLYEYCKEHDLYLFIDGARLASALVSDINDMSAIFLANHCDAFYLGGTKNGLTSGEALVINNDSLKANFLYQIKSRGAMSAKSMLLGIQFERIMQDNLFLNNAKIAYSVAKYLYNELVKLNMDVQKCESNQIFMKLNKKIGMNLSEKFGCEIWENLGESIVIRLVTSFISTIDDANLFINYLRKIMDTI